MVKKEIYRLENGIKQSEIDKKFEMINSQIAICNGDSMKVLKSIESNSIDACITDPPYFIDGMGNNWNTNILNKNNPKTYHPF